MKLKTISLSLLALSSLAQAWNEELNPNQPLKCAEGEFASSFALKPLGREFAPGLTGLPNSVDFLTAPRAVELLRLDLCINSVTSETTLKRLDMRMPNTLGKSLFVVFEANPENPWIDNRDGGGFVGTVGNEAVSAKGLSEAIFGDTTQLELAISLEKYRIGIDRISLKGVSDQAGPFVAAWVDGKSTFHFSNGKSILSWGGKLETVQPEDTGTGCDFGFTREPISLELGTAKIEIDACHSYTGTQFAGLTSVFYPIGLSVEDSNPTLSPEQKSFKVTGREETLKVMGYENVHHNFSDWIYIRLPHAEYFVSQGGSPARIENAPIGLAPPQEGFPKMGDNYRVRYLGGPWSKDLVKMKKKWEWPKNGNPGDLIIEVQRQ